MGFLTVANCDVRVRGIQLVPSLFNFAMKVECFYFYKEIASTCMWPFHFKDKVELCLYIVSSLCHGK
jgi:hypothetical protein